MQDADVFLSIIIPVYNVAAFLSECLDSCLYQDLDRGRYEMICIDDGSTDHSGRILDAYAEKYTNLHVIHQENGGVSAARNRGIEIAQGKYFWFVDPDDFIQDAFLNRLLRAVEENDAPDMVTFGVYEFGDYTTDCALSPEERAHKKELQNNRAPNEEYDATLCRHLYKSEIIAQNGIRFDPQILVCEDNVFHFIFEGQVKTQAMLRDVGYFYRKRRNSLSSGTADRYYESRIRIASLFLSYYRQMYGNHYIAGYLLSSQLKMVMVHIAKMKNPRRRKELRRLKKLRLFPLKIDEKDTFFEKKLEETSAANRLYNRMYNKDYTRCGYFWMRFFVLRKKVETFRKSN